MTPEMRDRARAGAAALGFDHVEIRDGDAQALPVDDDCADVVISNGVINLTTDKQEAFAEILRVLRPGGRLQLADIVVHAELSESIRNNVDLWAS
jgi:ubiquinone/menaquinone biosynthesis C-methylase UbiE